MYQDDGSRSYVKCGVRSVRSVKLLWVRPDTEQDDLLVWVVRESVIPLSCKDIF